MAAAAVVGETCQIKTCVTYLTNDNEAGLGPLWL